MAASQEQQYGHSEGLSFQLRQSSRQEPLFASLTLSAAAADAATANGLQLLPVGSHRGGKQQQYAWNGSKIVAINQDLLNEGYTAAGRLQDFFNGLHDNILSSFLPRKQDVTDDYWEWLKWRLGQRFFSATLQNFATQSLLMAVGVGARKALAASAAINWMLKDGMNRLVRMGVATQFGESFDSDLKRFRFTTSVLYTVCVSCEFLTPRFPSHFLLLTAVSNVGRAVGLTTFVSTQPAFQQALCASGNMADLASKTQAQHMVMDTLALAVSASANYFLRHKEAQRMMLPLVAFPICGLLDLFCIYHELKAVQLRSLNRERAEMVAQHWLEQGKIPTFKDISSGEQLMGPPNISGNLLPMRLLPLEATVSSPGQLQQLLSSYKGSKYLLAVQPGESIPWWDLPERFMAGYKAAPHIAVALASDAKPKDILTAVLEAAYLRRRLREQQQQVLVSLQQQQRRQPCSCSSSGCGCGGGSMTPQRRGSSSSSSNGGSSGNGGICSKCGGSLGSSSNGSDGSSSSVPLLPVEPLRLDVTEAESSSSSMRVDAKRQAERHVGRFLHELQGEGWQTKPFLLCTSEKSGFEKY